MNKKTGLIVSGALFVVGLVVVTFEVVCFSHPRNWEKNIFLYISDRWILFYAYRKRMYRTLNIFFLDPIQVLSFFVPPFIILFLGFAIFWRICQQKNVFYLSLFHKFFQFSVNKSGQKSPSNLQITKLFVEK